jgi:hypothetical protein
MGKTWNGLHILNKFTCVCQAGFVGQSTQRYRKQRKINKKRVVLPY